MNALPVGICRLCAQLRPLSFEHVPPQSAGNKVSLRAYSLGETYVQAAAGRARYTPEQRGSGANALCEPCNRLGSDRGYVAEMAKWTQIARDALGQIDAPDWAELERGHGIQTLGVRGVYPGRLARELVIQLLAINEPLLGVDYPGLRSFVLDESVSALPRGVRLSLGLDTLARGLTVPMSGVIVGDKAASFTEVVHPPLRFGLIFGSAPFGHGDITGFAAHHPSAVTTLKVRLPVNNGLLPEDVVPVSAAG